MESNKKQQFASFEPPKAKVTHSPLSEDARELAELVEDPEESIEYHNDEDDALYKLEDGEQDLARTRERKSLTFSLAWC